jgi:hypothetical protein
VVPSRKSKQEGEYPLFPEKPAYISDYNKEATAALPLRKVAASMVESIKEAIMLRDRLDFEVPDELLQQEDQQSCDDDLPPNGKARNDCYTDNEQDSHSDGNISDMDHSDDNDYKPNNRN